MLLKTRLAKDIAAVLVIKLIMILVAGFTLFGSHNRVHVTAETMAKHLAVAAPAISQEK